MTYHLGDTIAAVASAPGGAARGILRISGPATLDCLKRSFEPREGRLPTLTRPTVLEGELRLADLARRLPAAAYLWPTDRSYTREPATELHTLGSPPLLEAALVSICDAGARVAEPGEFTLRAFLAGRLDLTQAEAVLGVIDAHDRRELDVALSQLAGGLAAPLGRLRDDLLDLLAELEAGLDFVEEDIEFISAGDIVRRLTAAREAVDGVRDQMSSRGEARDLPRVVLLGCPNVGKSSLFNRLAAGADALVSDQSGTTRDFLTARIELDGVACELVDTAGAEPLASPGIGASAQAQRDRQHQQASIELFCVDSTRPLNPWEHEALARPPRGERIIVATKDDASGASCPCPAALPTSSVSGSGLDELFHRLHRAVIAGRGRAEGVVGVTAARCRESLQHAGESLDRAACLAAAEAGDELVAAEVRVGLGELGKVVGTVYTDDVLDRIFSRFCIGK